MLNDAIERINVRMDNKLLSLYGIAEKFEFEQGKYIFGVYKNGEYKNLYHFDKINSVGFHFMRSGIEIEKDEDTSVCDINYKFIVSLGFVAIAKRGECGIESDIEFINKILPAFKKIAGVEEILVQEIITDREALYKSILQGYDGQLRFEEMIVQINYKITFNSSCLEDVIC